MATVTAGTTFPLLMNEISLAALFDGTATDVTRSRIKIEHAPGSYVDFGGSFTFDSLGYLSGGQLNSITEVVNGVTVYSVTGFTMPMSTFLLYVENDRTEDAKARILGGADTITGSPFDDVLEGYDGDDVIVGGAGGDVLFGGAGADNLQGGDGDDVLAPGLGGGQVDGGAGDDFLFHSEAYGTTQRVTYDFSSVVPHSSMGAVTPDGVGGIYVARNIEHVYADGSEVSDWIRGSQGDDFLSGWGGNDHVIGGAGDDLVYGDDGDDLLSGGAGADFIDGGLGTDTAEVGGFRRHFDIDLTDGSATSARAGADALVSVETMVFRDGVLTVDTASTAAQVYRLYQATLGRTPDPEGLSNWVVALSTGAQSLQGVVDAFVGSVEFTQRYGALSDEQFVRLLYNNVLGRDADGPGLASWLQHMAGGATRAQVVLGFSESLELIDNTADEIQAGLWVQDPTAMTLARLYDTALGRLPDAGGLESWLDALATGGKSIQNVAEAFMGSAEFLSRYGQVGNEDFVELLYRNALDREPDAPGLEGWTRALDNGLSRAELLLAFSESQEHKGLIAGQVDGGLWFA